MNRHVISMKIPDFEGREIVISDIHGNLEGYCSLLEICQYDPQKDRLILLGDLVEKGPENLKLLRLVMEQAKNPEVHVIMGNCDFVAKSFLFSYRLEYIQKVLLERENSLIHEMIAEAGWPALSEQTDMDQLAMDLRRVYLKELSFLNDLPHVIETPSRIYVHAGLLDEKTYAPDFRYVLTYPLFGKTETAFTKLVVAGHMPVTEYCVRKADFNPRYHAQNNILSIDGGNIVKDSGQLNAVIFTPHGMQSRFTDSLPTARVLHSTHPKNLAPFFIGWNDGDIEILEEQPMQSLVYSPSLNRRFWIDNSFIKANKGTDFTNYEMPLNRSETVSVVCRFGDKVQIKKMGILGWTHEDNLDLSGL